jgi:hypothetical protein
MGEKKLITQWRQRKKKPVGKFEIGCMNQFKHSKVPFIYTVREGDPRECPKCGRAN